MAEQRKSKVTAIKPPPGHRRLLMCFDGTWNSLESQTNVLRMFRALASVDTACADQVVYYDIGVGAEQGNRFWGGFEGRGLGKNVLDGYCWLVNNYKPGKPARDRHLPKDRGVTAEHRRELFSHGDLIFLTGFSRGAFTARSLASMINRVGILDRARLEAAGQVAPGAPVTRETPQIKAAWDLYKMRETKGEKGPRRYRKQLVNFRAEHSHNVKITCVAVWDTVGALGIPYTLGRRWLAPFRRRHAFHDTRLGRVIEHAYHAVAIDEHRPDFAATLWTREDDDPPWARDVEQRWFPGAHANVGGGYDDDLLCERPLFWVAQKFADLGVVFRRDREDPPYHNEPPYEFRLDGNEYLSPVRDSFRGFAGGLYPMLLKLARMGRNYRGMLIASEGVGQTIDPSARLKWDVDPDYRPINLATAGRPDDDTPAITRADLIEAQGERR